MPRAITSLAPKVVADTISTTMALLGFRPGGLPDQEGQWALSIDAGVCKDLPCEGCDREGMMDFLAFHTVKPRAYRCFAVCPVCSHVEEM